MSADRSPYAPLPVADPVVTTSPLAPTVDGRGAAAAMFAALVAGPGVLLPVPWSAAWGAVVGLFALGYASSAIGGGRAGAVAGALIGIAVGTPAALPIFVQLAFLPFGGESAGLGSDGLVVRLSASLAAVTWAVLAATVAVPLAFSIVGRLAPPGASHEGLSRVSRAVPVLVLLHLVPVTIAEVAAVPDLVAKIAAFGVRTDAIAVWAAAAGFVAYGLLRLGFWGGALLMLRRGFRIAPLPVSRGTSAILGGILVAAVWLPAAWLGLAIALGPVSWIIPWSQGGFVTVDWTRLYNATAEPEVLVFLGGLFQTSLALGLIGLARKIVRAWELRRAPYRLPPIRKP